MAYFEDTYDIVVVGAGHAGCEAALACARLGFETICFTVSMDSVALMPCNPNIGGSSKGHLVKEIDALGGEMGKNIDKTYIQSKMLNESKGPAVHSLRAQADKQSYTYEMRKIMENTEHLSSNTRTQLLPWGLPSTKQTSQLVYVWVIDCRLCIRLYPLCFDSHLVHDVVFVVIAGEHSVQVADPDVDQRIGRASCRERV